LPQNEVAWDQFNNLLDIWQTTPWPIPALYGQIVLLLKDDKDLLEGFRGFLAHNYPDGKSLFHNAHYVGEFHAVHFSFTFWVPTRSL
jgi:histone deacetylase complex regulatory component SIN3